MNDETRKKLERHRLPKDKEDRIKAKIPPGVMDFVRQQATPQLMREMLRRYDAKEISAVDFVEIARQWLKRPD